MNIMTGTWVARQLELIRVELTLTCLDAAVLWMAHERGWELNTAGWLSVAFSTSLYIVLSTYLFALSVQETVKWFVEMIEEMKK